MDNQLCLVIVQMGLFDTVVSIYQVVNSLMLPVTSNTTLTGCVSHTGSGQQLDYAVACEHNIVNAE